MNKTIFIKRIDGKPSKPCQPFLGWRVSNFNEFLLLSRNTLRRKLAILV